MLKNMKKINFLFLLTVAGIFSLSFGLDSCSQAPKTDEAQVQDTVAILTQPVAEGTPIDVANSKITWIGTKPTGKHNGTLGIKAGSLKLENGALTAGKIEIDLNALTVLDLTDEKKNADLTGHLKSDDFFDIAKFPTASFEITGTAPYTPDPAAKKEAGDMSIADANTNFTGNLTLKGVTKTITFPAKVTIEGNNVSAVANFNIDRTQWNINYQAEGSVPDKFIHNKVNIGFEVKTVAAK